MTKKKIAFDVVNPHAAGIDVGSRSHYVAGLAMSKNMVYTMKISWYSRNGYWTME